MQNFPWLNVQCYATSTSLMWTYTRLISSCTTYIHQMLSRPLQDLRTEASSAKFHDAAKIIWKFWRRDAFIHQHFALRIYNFCTPGSKHASTDNYKTKPCIHVFYYLKIIILALVEYEVRSIETIYSAIKLPNTIATNLSAMAVYRIRAESSR